MRNLQIFEEFINTLPHMLLQLKTTLKTEIVVPERIFPNRCE